MKLMSAKKPLKFGDLPRRVAFLCCEGRIPGVRMVVRSWVVPVNAKKPADARVKSGQYAKVKDTN